MFVPFAHLATIVMANILRPWIVIEPVFNLSLIYRRFVNSFRKLIKWMKLVKFWIKLNGFPLQFLLYSQNHCDEVKLHLFKTVPWFKMCQSKKAMDFCIAHIFNKLPFIRLYFYRLYLIIVIENYTSLEYAQKETTSITTYNKHMREQKRNRSRKCSPPLFTSSELVLIQIFPLSSETRASSRGWRGNNGT